MRKTSRTPQLAAHCNRSCRIAANHELPQLPQIFSFCKKIFLDFGSLEAQNSLCCFDVRRYLSWIEGLTTNQYVGGSNPSRRTTLTAGAATTVEQHVRFFYCHLSERNVLEGSKIEASQYVIFRLHPRVGSRKTTAARSRKAPPPSSPFRLQ